MFNTWVTRRNALLGISAITGSALNPRFATADTEAGGKDRDCHAARLPVNSINAVFAPVPGMLQPDGTLIFDISRSDLSTSLSGMAVDPGIGFASEIGFQPSCDGALVKWEFCLLEPEIQLVMDSI